MQACQKPWRNSTFGCREDSITGKTALLGAERTKSLEKNSTLGCREDKITGKTALSGAERNGLIRITVTVTVTVL